MRAQDEKSLDEINYSKKIVYLFILMMADYIMTYIGINHLRFIEEANPLLVWLFELPFYLGFLIRFGYVSFMAWVLMFIYDRGYEHYNLMINFVLAVNAIVVFIHLRWIIFYGVKVFNS